MKSRVSPCMENTSHAALKKKEKNESMEDKVKGDADFCFFSDALNLINLNHNLSSNVSPYFQDQCYLLIYHRSPITLWYRNMHMSVPYEIVLRLEQITESGGLTHSETYGALELMRMKEKRMSRNANEIEWEWKQMRTRQIESEEGWGWVYMWEWDWMSVRIRKSEK